MPTVCTADQSCEGDRRDVAPCRTSVRQELDVDKQADWPSARGSSQAQASQRPYLIIVSPSAMHEKGAACKIDDSPKSSLLLCCCGVFGQQRQHTYMRGPTPPTVSIARSCRPPSASIPTATHPRRMMSHVAPEPGFSVVQRGGLAKSTVSATFPIKNTMAGILAQTEAGNHQDAHRFARTVGAVRFLTSPGNADSAQITPPMATRLSLNAAPVASVAIPTGLS